MKRFRHIFAFLALACLFPAAVGAQYQAPDGSGATLVKVCANGTAPPTPLGNNIPTCTTQGSHQAVDVNVVGGSSGGSGGTTTLTLPYGASPGASPTANSFVGHSLFNGTSVDPARGGPAGATVASAAPGVQYVQGVGPAGAFQVFFGTAPPFVIQSLPPVIIGNTPAPGPTDANGVPKVDAVIASMPPQIIASLPPVIIGNTPAPGPTDANGVPKVDAVIASLPPLLIANTPAPGPTDANGVPKVDAVVASLPPVIIGNTPAPGPTDTAGIPKVDDSGSTIVVSSMPPQVIASLPPVTLGSDVTGKLNAPGTIGTVADSVQGAGPSAVPVITSFATAQPVGLAPGLNQIGYLGGPVGTSPALTAVNASYSVPIGGGSTCTATTAGTFVATLQFQVTVDNSAFSSTTASNTYSSVTTVAGTYQFNDVAGYQYFRVIVTAFTSGSPTVTIHCGMGTFGGPITSNTYGAAASVTSPGDLTGQQTGLDTVSQNEFYGVSGWNRSRDVTAYGAPSNMYGVLSIGTVCNQSVAVSAANAVTQVVALSGTTRVYVCGFTLSATTTSGAATVTFENGTGTNCATGTATNTGAMSIAASSPLVNQVGPPDFYTAAGAALCILPGGTGTSLSGFVTYGQF